MKAMKLPQGAEGALGTGGSGAVDGDTLPVEERSPGAPFVAIDFETADYGRDSACAVALVTVQDGVIVDRFYQLIRPPRRDIVFSYLHGIEWEDVKDQPTFAEAWPRIEAHIRRGQYLAAHNARFDSGVLQSCCVAAGIMPPDRSFLCTVRLARKAWGIYPTKLPDVCRRLCIPLHHHRADSDAEACARIVMTALEEGVDLERFRSQGAG